MRKYFYILLAAIVAHAALAVETESDKRINATEEATAYIRSAGDHLEKGLYALAVADMNEAIKLTPRHSGSYRLRATAYFKRGNNFSALTDLEKAIELDPQDARNYDVRFKVYEKIAKIAKLAEIADEELYYLGKAKADLEKSIELDKKASEEK